MFKKSLVFLLTAVFIFTIPIFAYADGIGDDQIPNHLGVVDYRDMNIGKDPDYKRPKAGFSLQIKSGDKISEEVPSGKIDDEGYISSSPDSPVIQAKVGDKIIINDRCTVGSGSKITQYDIQYRFTPEGKNREDYVIHPAIVGSFDSVKNIIENLPLTEPGTYEIYLAVADNAQCLPGATNWSANGNVRTINYSNKNFPNGMFWYFTGAVVEVKGGPGEIITTEPHETKEAWTETTHFNPGKTLAQRYNDGDTVDLKFIFHNEAKDIAYGDTNYVITHWGAGLQGAFENQIMPAVKKGEATEELTYSYKIDLAKVPQSARVDGGIRLVIIGDPEHKVSNSESRKNYMTVNIPVNGIDVMVDCNSDYTIKIKPGETRTINLEGGVSLKYFEGMPYGPVDVDVTISSPLGTTTERIILDPRINQWGKDYSIPYTVNKPGIYTLELSAYPVGVMDIDLSNNQDKCSITVIIELEEQPYKSDSDRETRVNLVG